MKYGEIKWKVEKIVFKVRDGNITQRSEIDQGKTLITNIPQTFLSTNTNSSQVQSG